MILDIIFVRHGLSCANVLSKKQPGRQFLYQDPELTLEGIQNSKDFSPDLLQFIQETWGDNPRYIIGASQMIRAQETAFHMLASVVNRPIHIFPHIGEVGITYDNYSLPRGEQRTLLNKPIDAGILENLIEENDHRKQQTLDSKSDFPSFIDWINKSNLIENKDRPEPHRLVIFTHGLFLRSIRGGLEHFENNDAMRVIYDTTAKEMLEPLPEIHRINNRKISYDCPDDCRISRCSDEAPRNWGSAGQKERKAIFSAEKGAAKYTDLYNIQKPKTLKNYFKRGLYGVKRLFNRKSFSQRIKSAENKRNRLVQRIGTARRSNRARTRATNRLNAVRRLENNHAKLHRLQNPRTFKDYMKRGYYGVKRMFNRKSFSSRLRSAMRKVEALRAR